jgi:hypothetical protein
MAQGAAGAPTGVSGAWLQITNAMVRELDAVNRVLFDYTGMFMAAGRTSQLNGQRLSAEGGHQSHHQCTLAAPCERAEFPALAGYTVSV